MLLQIHYIVFAVSSVCEYMERVLVIVVTYNAMHWVGRCLDSVMSSSLKVDLFIVDNGSTDGTGDYISTHYPEAILFLSPTNLKFGKGNNVGLEYALKNGYDYVYLLNQDAWVKPDTISILLKVHSTNQKYGILSPLHMASDEKNFEFIFNRLIASKFSEGYIKKDVIPVGFVQAAHMLISRECLEKVGGFSPSFPHYGEDDNYCQRVLYHGYKIGIVPSAKAVHDAANKPLTTNVQKRYRHYITFVIALSNVNNSQSLPSLLSFLFRRAKGLAVERKSMTSFGGYFKALAHLPQIRRNRKLSMTEKCVFLKHE